jgi:predicted component of type VI protein secretion system
MKIQLSVTNLRDGTSTPVACPLAVAGRLVFGRDLSSPMDLEGPGVSREHFNIFEADGNVRIEDLSSNGTSLNGTRMAREEPRQLADGDTIEIPGYRIEVHFAEDESLPAPVPDELEPQPASPPRWLAPVVLFARSFTGLEKFALLMSACSITFALVAYRLN